MFSSKIKVNGGGDIVEEEQVANRKGEGFETANWFNALLARACMNVKQSGELMEKVKRKMEQKLQSKVEEKNFENYVVRLQHQPSRCSPPFLHTSSNPYTCNIFRETSKYLTSSLEKGCHR